MTPLQQTWPVPSKPRPIVIIGAGDIVRDAHLPAYRKAGLPVAGIFDINAAVARQRADEFKIPRVYGSMTETTTVPDAIFDVATPPKAHGIVLQQLPDEAVVLIQKPMGRTMDNAKSILEICRRKRLTAAINFQLRFSPHLLAIRDLVRRGSMGQIVDVEVRLNLQTPWDSFPFLMEEPRVEVLIHTIHYLDFVRSILGNPAGVYARVAKHPKFPKFADLRSSIILNYGDSVRCSFAINHCHPFGPEHSDATIRVEGTAGAAIARLGALLDYPRGRPDKLEVITAGETNWTDVPLIGNWFPDAFIGTMSNLQRFAAGEDEALISPVADAIQTMALVEACYASDASGGTKMEQFL
jgi:predicted dehydrogenase